ncbi:hypothetical protein GCM10009841_27630 [Microlunatus panaciterrae]|uniref:beta-N-acetylhexosaminidase n=1 Tax=Microlunatus panaciterrae TaxID=400768 RepID=A0ABS2RI02_9ACTN|nr:glycoside hydrolase family 3 N-terminal domain-containing protein [Microlunatus panaciterrae]MBM7798353.1 beta-N-acetylhexosaminidase [Microlunatus panaciterrae]
MIGIGSGGPSTDEASTLAEAHAGSVILLGNTQAGSTAVKDVTRAVRRVVAAPHGIQVMLAADQEGGLVQRLQGSGFDRIPSALDQAQLSDSRLTRDAESWGEQLHRAGIDADLAPVADVVPASLLNVNQPIGRLRRGYGSDPRTVAAKVTAFTTGMDRAGIATSVKHFPGLGRVRGNTDFATRVVDSTTTRHDPALRGFAAGVRAGVDMVMVSSATYSRIDPDHPGPYSRTIIEGMIRQDLRFRGVVISDDLAGKAVSGLSPGQRALRFLDAGGDLVIMGDPGLAPAMVRAVRAEARDDPEFAARLTTKVTRVLTMKERRGLADCG